MKLTEEEYLLLIGQLYCEKKKSEQLLAAVMRMKDEQSEINTKLVKRIKELEGKDGKKETGKEPPGEETGESASDATANRDDSAGDVDPDRREGSNDS